MTPTGKILRLFGEKDQAAAELIGNGLTRQNVCDWRHRRIPPEWFATLVAVAEREGIQGVTFDTLYRVNAEQAELAARRREGEAV